MTHEDVKRLADWVARCNFPNLSLVVVYDVDNTAFLQVEGTGPDNHAPERTITWKGRKWRLSAHMTETEVVKTALLAVKAALEHEMLEQFTYDGVALFDPHLSVTALKAARREYPLDGRPPPPNPYPGDEQEWDPQP